MIRNIIDSFRYKIFFVLNSSEDINLDIKRTIKNDVYNILDELCLKIHSGEFEANCLVIDIDIEPSVGRSPTRFANTLRDKLRNKLDSKRDIISGRSFKDIIDLESCSLIPITINTKIKENI